MHSLSKEVKWSNLILHMNRRLVKFNIIGSYIYTRSVYIEKRRGVEAGSSHMKDKLGSISNNQFVMIMCPTIVKKLSC